MEEQKINKEIVLPKIWFLILGIITALFLPPFGVIWGIVLLAKKYRIEGIIFLSVALLSMIAGVFIVYQDLMPELSGPGALEQGQILPEELQELPLTE